MEVPVHYLYRITNQLNSKVYIGQTKEKNLGRWKKHKYYAKHPDKTGQYIHHTMAKYGIENFIFEIIATCKTQEDANEAEEQLIAQYDSRNKKYGYNLTADGTKWDDERRKQLSDKLKQYYREHPELKQILSERALTLWKNQSHRDLVLSTTKETRFKKGHEVSGYIKNKVSETQKARHAALGKGATKEEAEAIRTEYATGLTTYKKLAEKYNKGRYTIVFVITGKKI